MAGPTLVEPKRWGEIRRRVYLPEEVDEYQSSSQPLAGGSEREREEGREREKKEEEKEREKGGMKREREREGGREGMERRKSNHVLTRSSRCYRHHSGVHSHSLLCLKASEDGLYQ